MENLWKKQSERPGSFYVDCFKHIDESDVEKVNIWLRAKIKGASKASNRFQPVSNDRRLRKRKWANQLQPIEDPSKQRKNPVIHGKRRKGFRSKAFFPELNFGEHDQVADIANVLEIKYNAQFGRHIVANCDIDVGKVIAVGEPFADAVICDSPYKRAYCLTCKKTGTNFIGCDNCADVKFCSELCKQMNQVHQFECNSIYHRIESLEVKLAIQMVLVTISDFLSADKLITHFETLLAKDSLCRNGLMLNLTRSSRDDNILRAYKAYQCLMTMQSINKLFNSKRKQRFLMHLVLHYLAIVPSNAWDSELNDEKNFEMKYIYGVISLFNHNCAPNVFYSIHRNLGYCLTVRPIKKGEQVFVSYLGDRVEESKANRQNYLKREWDFVCSCERCKPNRIYDRMDVADDPSWRYVCSHYDDYLQPFGSKRRNRLRNECANFLRKHGYQWSKALDQVIKLFILATTHDEKQRTGLSYPPVYRL